MHQHRHGGAADDLVGDAAQEETFQAAPAVRFQGDGVVRRGVGQDGQGRLILGLDVQPHAQTTLAQFRRRSFQVFLGVLAQLILDALRLVDQVAGHVRHGAGVDGIGERQHLLDDAEQGQLGLHGAGEHGGRLQHLLGERRAVQRHQQAAERDLPCQVRLTFVGTHEQQRHRQIAHQLVGDAAHPETAQRTATVRRHDHQVGVDRSGPRPNGRGDVAFHHRRLHVAGAGGPQSIDDAVQVRLMAGALVLAEPLFEVFVDVKRRFAVDGRQRGHDVNQMQLGAAATSQSQGQRQSVFAERRAVQRDQERAVHDTLRDSGQGFSLRMASMARSVPQGGKRCGACFPGNSLVLSDGALCGSVTGGERIRPGINCR
jgi:hypothetical protein